MTDQAQGTETDNPWSHGWRLVVGLAILAALVAATIWVAVMSVRTLRSLDVEVAAAIVSAFAALLIALVTTWLGRFLERRSVEARSQQEKRIPVYEAFVSDLLRMMEFTKHRDERKGPDDREIVEVLASFTEKAIVWGSGDVLKAWVDFRYLGIAGVDAPDSEAHGYRLLVKLEELFLALRADLGLDNGDLARGDLLKLFINDLDPAVLGVLAGDES